MVQTESKEVFEQELEDEYDYDRYITLQRAVSVICGLGNKKLIRTDIFSKQPVDDWYGHKHLIYEYLMDRFKNHIFTNEYVVTSNGIFIQITNTRHRHNRLMISFSVFLGFLIEIMLCTIEELFSRLTKYLEGDDDGQDQEFDFLDFLRRKRANKPMHPDDPDSTDDYSTDADEERSEFEEPVDTDLDLSLSQFDFNKYSSKTNEATVREYMNTSDNGFDIAATFIEKFVEETDLNKSEDKGVQVKLEDEEEQNRRRMLEVQEVITRIVEEEIEENRRRGRGIEEEEDTTVYENIDEYIIINSKISKTKRLVRKDLNILQILKTLSRMINEVYTTEDILKFFERVEDLVEIMLYRLDTYKGNRLDINTYIDFVNLDAFLRLLRSRFEQFPQVYIDYVDEWRKDLARAIQRFIDIRTSSKSRNTDRNVRREVVEEEVELPQKDLIPFTGIGNVHELDVSVYIRELRKMIKTEKDNIQMHLDIVNSGGDVSMSPLSPKKKVKRQREVYVREEVRDEYQEKINHTSARVDQFLDSFYRKKRMTDGYEEEVERFVRLENGDKPFSEDDTEHIADWKELFENSKWREELLDLITYARAEHELDTDLANETISDSENSFIKRGDLSGISDSESNDNYERHYKDEYKDGNRRYVTGEYESKKTEQWTTSSDAGDSDLLEPLDD
jgi:hypothetical protein